MKLFYSQKKITSKELFGFGRKESEMVSGRLLAVLIKESRQHIFLTGLNGYDKNEIISLSLVELYRAAVKKENEGAQINNVVPYFIRIFNNEAINYLKKERKRNKSSVSLNEIPDKILEHTDKIHKDEDVKYYLTAGAKKKVHDYMDELNDKEQQVIKMQYFAGFSQEKIGQLLGMNPDTVKTTIYRAKEKLRKSFGIKNHRNEN